MTLENLDAQIEKLREGDTLPENEVKALCEKVCFCTVVYTVPSSRGRQPMKDKMQKENFSLDDGRVILLLS